MPAIITPIDTDRRNRRVEENDNGNGRRPPTDKRTGGGGENNDNFRNRPQGRRGPRERLSRYRLGLFFALAGDLMFFIAIVSAFFVSQASGHFDAYNRYINEWLPTPVPRVLWLNTAVLLVSSFTMEIARRGMFREIDVMEEWLGMGKPSTRRALPWLSVTILLGFAFLAGQLLAWKQLAAIHVFFKSNPSSHFFFLITAVHGVHLFLGLTALVSAVIGLFVSRQVETRQILVDCAAWYWHSMGVLWLFLFGLLAFFQ